jgi:hypothetical protein
MALLPSRRPVVIVLLLLSLCASAAAQQAQPSPVAGPGLDLTVRVSREGKLYAVTGADFYLLDGDPRKLLKDAGVKLTRYLSYGEDEGEALVAEFVTSARLARAGGFSGGSKYLQEFYDRANSALRPHIVAVATTDDDGKAMLTTTKPGAFYVVGAARPPVHAVWALPARLDQDHVSVRLDSSNTMSASRVQASQ